VEYDTLLNRIIKSDSNIRHCIIADTDGNIKAVKHKDGVENYLSDVETAASLKRAASSWKARKQLAPKIGPGQYAVAAFEKLTRMTFPLGENHLVFASMSSNPIKMELGQGGRADIVEHVLNILSGDPTKN
jgi:hypothetical protein|tara:strand:- start:613 stop:1005 length:393 start_codon:yes stop_codon:yes gene_type:complete